MRIADPNSPGNTLPVSPQPAAPARPDSPAAGAAGTMAAGPDRTELSDVADRLSGMFQAGSTDRADRIQQLKAAVASGSYHVDADAVSHALVQEALSTAGDPTPGKP